MTAPNDNRYTPTPAYRIDPATPAVGEPTDDEVLTQFQPVEKRPSGVRRWAKILLIAAAVIAVAVTVGSFTRGSAPGIITPPLVKAQQDCDPYGHGTTIADGKKTLVVDGSGNTDGTGVSVEAEACILKQLGATAAVLAHIESTRALDGRQTDSWGGFKVAWSYHPDEGLDLVIQQS